MQISVPRLTSGNFYGETLRQHQVSGFSLSESHYSRGSHLPRHSHESDYFCFVLSGSYKESYEKQIRCCEPLTIVYHPAGELHAQSFDTSAVDLFRIEVRYPSYSDLSVAGCDFRGGAAAVLASKLYREFQEPDEVSHLAIEGLGLELLAALARDSQRGKKMTRHPPDWLGRAYELVKANYLQNLTLIDVAEPVGVHPVTLAREFRRHYQCTVGDLVRRERIAFACRALAKTETSIAGVAACAGFYDQSHFAKVFKRLMGMTPRSYRDRFSSH